jgi:lipopolysaccharide export system protein LptA
MRRYRGTTVSDETSGALITYDNTTDQFHRGRQPGGATPGPIRAAVSAPRWRPARRRFGAPAPAPAASAPLRSSTTLGGEKR